MMTPELELASWQRRIEYLEHEAAILWIYGCNDEAKIFESSAAASRGMVEHIRRELARSELPGNGSRDLGTLRAGAPNKPALSGVFRR